MKIKFRHWKDTVPHKFSIGRNAHLRNVRSWYAWIGRNCFVVEVHGLGPTP